MLKIFYLFVVLNFIAFHASAQNTIGDIKYSILPPDSFMKYNRGWVLMDGGSSKASDSIFKDSPLHHSFKVKELPDARGLFIRGMNVGRDIKIGDAAGDRDIGTYQEDEFEQHHHGGGAHSHLGQWAASADSWGNAVTFGAPVRSDVRKKTPEAEKIIKPDGKAETRPRNICFYIYLKVTY